MALRIADVGYVLETGRITLTGSGRELLQRGGQEGLSGHLSPGKPNSPAPSGVSASKFRSRAFDKDRCL